MQTTHLLLLTSSSTAACCFLSRHPTSIATPFPSRRPHGHRFTCLASPHPLPPSATSPKPPPLTPSAHIDGLPPLPPSSSSPPLLLFSSIPLIYPALAENTGYSQASYYTSLGLFIISVPGLWSLIKRSTKSKIVKKTFLVPGPSAVKGKSTNQVAGEITSSLTRNNFAVADRGETVTFEGTMVPSRGQASFLIFCTCISLASVALVLSITVPDVGDKWYWLSALSPLAGVYYWTKASRKEQIKVKMVISDDEQSTDVVVQGDDEQVDRLRKELGFMEKDMVYVKGILER